MIGSVLLQPSKSSDMGAGLGGGGQALFGGRGPVTFLSKVTWVAIVLLMLTSITLSVYTKRMSIESSVIDMTEPETKKTDSSEKTADSTTTDKVSDSDSASTSAESKSDDVVEKKADPVAKDESKNKDH